MNSETTALETNQLWERARKCLENRQLPAAQGCLESLVRRIPEHLPARLLLARVMLERGYLRAATALLLEAVPPVAGGDAGKVCELAQLLFITGETVAARECLEFLQAQNSHSAEVLVRMAHVRHLLGETNASLALMHRAIKSGADAPHDHHFHGMLLQFVGRMDAAAEVLEHCMQRWPNFGSAALTLARLRRQTPEANHIEHNRRQLKNVAPNSLDHASFEFALFKELHDLEHYDDAWAALTKANSIMHVRNPYDAGRDKQLMDATIEWVGPVSKRCVEKACPGPAPIFVLGMPRSGTTLLDRMLSNHSRVVSAGEISDFFKQWRWVSDIGGQHPQDMLGAIRRSADMDFNTLGLRYLKQTQWRARGHDYFIDKMPNNFHLIGFIHRALPHARILHVSRDPMAVCYSNYKAMLGDTSPHTYDLQLLGNYYRQHERLRRHWLATLPNNILDVPYAALVQSPETVMRKVLRFCGLEFEPMCVDPTQNAEPVSTPSSAQVREPIHMRGIEEWNTYEDRLEPLRRALR